MYSMVDKKLNVVEAFIGLYDSPSSTTGQSIANCIFDILTRFQLPISQQEGKHMMVPVICLASTMDARLLSMNTSH